jgi:hypothetical protein
VPHDYSQKPPPSLLHAEQIEYMFDETCRPPSLHCISPHAHMLALMEEGGAFLRVSRQIEKMLRVTSLIPSPPTRSTS